MRWLALALLAVVMPLPLAAHAHGVKEDPPDACLRSEPDAACKPVVGSTGKCRWLSIDERNDMELPGRARCEAEGGRCVRYLMCVSGIFDGDTPAMLTRADELVSAHRIDEADALLRYLRWSERAPCDSQMAARWHRLGKAADAAGETSSGFYYQAMACDPGLHAAYFDLAAYWCTRPARESRIGMAADALLQLSRAMLNRDAAPSEWAMQARLLSTDPRLETLRRSPAYAAVKERFTTGARIAAQRLPYPYCQLEPAAARARKVAAESMNCGFPEGLTLTTCPDHYIKLRAAEKPSKLPICDNRDR